MWPRLLLLLTASFAVVSLLAQLPSTFAHSHRHGRNHGHREQHGEKDPIANASSIYIGATARPVPARPLSALPVWWDWCDVDGVSYCTSSWNQHIPKYCGSCWVHGALAAANDRIKILLNGRHDVLLARQVILNCGEAHGLGAGCNGGESFDVFEYMRRHGLPDESCANYVAESAPVCDQQAVCSNCMPVGQDVFPYKCWPVPSPILYYVHAYGSVHGEEAMMSEIYARGPITCGFASVDDFDYGYRGGIYIDRTNATEMNHDVEVVGWGEDGGVPYWKARNSWGTYWGENSFFRIARGINNMQFESDCTFALFDVHHLQDVLRGRLGGSMFGVVEQRDKLLNMSRDNPHVHEDDDDDEEDDEHGRDDSRRHRGDRRGRQGGGEVKSGHFGGEPTAPRRLLQEHMRAWDAQELIDGYRPLYTTQQPQGSKQTAGDEAQRELDRHTQDRESRRSHKPGHPDEDEKRRKASKLSRIDQHYSKPLHAKQHRTDDYYVRVMADSDAVTAEEQSAEQSILNAIREAYQHEQARELPSASSAATAQQEVREREKDEAAIASAIHAALGTVGSRDKVKAMLVRALRQLEADSAQDTAAQPDKRQHDFAVVEDEVSRMWRYESAYDSQNDGDEHDSAMWQPQDEGSDGLVAAELDEAEPHSGGRRVGGYGVSFGVVVGAVLTAVMCGGLLCLLVRHKERDDYDEL